MNKLERIDRANTNLRWCLDEAIDECDEAMADVFAALDPLMEEVEE